MNFWHWSTLILLTIVIIQNGLSIARWVIGKVREGQAVVKGSK